MPPLDDDAAFWRAFLDRAIPVADFGHEAHLRAAFLCLTNLGFDDALPAMRSGLREMLALAVERGYDPPVGYHETITIFWLRTIAARLAPNEARDSRAFLRDNADLGDKRLIAQHYSKDRLMSDEARARFIEPDRAPLPVAGAC